MDSSATSVDVTASLPIWLLSLLIFSALLFAIWSYRRTLPPVKPALRIVLTLLRWGSICGAIIIFTQPVIEIKTYLGEPATVSILVDRSASMDLQQGGVDKVSQVENLFGSDEYRDFQRRYNTRILGFADSVVSQAGSITEDVLDIPFQIGTNISRAIMEANSGLSLNPPAATFIISDGAHNVGPDPSRLARTNRTPIWTIGIGSSESSRDLMIRSVSVNPVVYQNSKTPVEVGYRCIGVAGEQVILSLHDSRGKVIERKNFTPSSSFSEGSLSFEIEVNTSGRQRFVAAISRFDDEMTFDNNQRSFYLNVLASRMRVLVMAGPPDNGLGDLIRRMKGDEHVELILRITRRGSFYEGGWLDKDELAKVDVVFLHHFPVKSNDKAKLSEFVERIKEANLPICFIDGGQTNLSRFALFADLLPVRIKSNVQLLSEDQVIPVRRHAIIADPDQPDFTIGWSGLPPLIFNTRGFVPDPHGEVLAEFANLDDMSRFPAIVISEAGGMRTAAILGRNLWRWGLASPGEEGIMEPFLSRLIRWLAVRKVHKRVDIEFDKEMFSTHESVGFNVTVQNESYLPIDGAEVRVVISLDDTVGSEIILDGIGQGRYRGFFLPWDEGEYFLNVEASVEGEVIGSDQDRIAVEPFNIELFDAKMNEELLRSIGEFSGGGYVQATDADSLFSSLDIPSEIREDVKRWEFWGRGWILAVIIIMLGIEWFIRARTGML